MKASTGAEGGATIGDRTEHFCRQAQGGGGLRQGFGIVPASKGERDRRKADGGTAQRACRQQHSCLCFAIFPLPDRAASIALGARQRGRPQVADDTKLRPQNGREQPVGLSLFVAASTNSRPCIAGCAANSDRSPGSAILRRRIGVHRD